MRISDWSSYVCSSDLGTFVIARHGRAVSMVPAMALAGLLTAAVALPAALLLEDGPLLYSGARLGYALIMGLLVVPVSFALITVGPRYLPAAAVRSEEHTSELQSLMRISYAVFCLKKKKQKTR